MRHLPSFASALCAIFVFACGDDDAAPIGDGATFAVEPFVPGAASPLRLGSGLAVRGDSTVVGAFFSIDGRRTWQFLPEDQPIQGWQWVTDTSGAYGSRSGLRFLDLETGAQVTHTPPAGAPWLVVGRSLVVLEQVELSASDPDGPGVRPRLLMIPVDGVGASWTTLDLPVMPEASRTYQPSLHHGHDGTVYVVAKYGMHHGAPEADAAWTFYPLVPDGGTISWADNPVWVTRGGAIYVSTSVSFDGGETFSHRGRSEPPWEHQDDDGRLYRGWQRSDDGGETWTELLDEATRERLGERNANVRIREGEVHVERSVYVHLVVYPDGRIESLVPHVVGHRDSHARNAEDVVVLEDGRLLGHVDGDLFRIAPGDRAWTWLRATPAVTTLQALSDGRVAMFSIGSPLGELRLSDDGGSTWSEPRSTPNLSRIFEYDDEWLGSYRTECGVVFHTTTDEFVTWETRTDRVPVFEPSGEPVDRPYEFEARAMTDDGVLHGNATGFAIDLNGRCSAHIAYPVRSTDRAMTAVRVPTPEYFAPRVLATNARGGLVGMTSDGAFHFQRRGGAWAPVGVPVLADGLADPPVPLDLIFEAVLPPVRFDADDHLLIPTGEGLVRTRAPLR
ncbi:MAG: hypothetical protein KF901_32005 [Myxococcales bacterium]|nr:hypothetical protein [Myxococcales bacterium]